MRNGHDDIDRKPDQLGGQLGQPLGPARSPAPLDGDVLPVDQARFAQAFSQQVLGQPRRVAKHPDPTHAVGRLSAGRQRTRNRRAAEKGDDISPVHPDDLVGASDGAARVLPVEAAPRSRSANPNRRRYPSVPRPTSGSVEIAAVWDVVASGYHFGASRPDALSPRREASKVFWT